MTDRRVVIGFPVIPLIFAIIAYFVYGKSLDAVLAVFLLDCLWNVAILVCIIPFVGVFIYWWLLHYIFDWVHGLTGLKWSWLLDVMMWFNLIIGTVIWVVFTVAITFILAGKIRKECYIDETGRKICRWVWR